MTYADTAASNFPYHRGSATAFPLSAYGLSAVFFSSLSTMAFRGDTTHFLLLLAVGTPSMIFVSSLFLRIIPHSPSYSVLPHQDPGSRSRQGKLERTASAKTTDHSTLETGTQKDFSRFSNLPDVDDALPSSSSASAAACTEQTVSNTAAEETSSLMACSETDAVSPPLCGRDSTCEEGRKTLEPHHNSLYADVRGLALLLKIEFWQLFVLMGILTGIGLMTIK